MDEENKRLEPCEEGSMPELYRLFVQPFVKLKPEELGHVIWLEAIWTGAGRRDVKSYSVIKAFKIPGSFRGLDGKVIPGYGYRYADVGKRVWIRTDMDIPNRIDMEIMIGPSRLSHVFQLSKLEWETIQNKLQVI